MDYTTRDENRDTRENPDIAHGDFTEALHNYVPGHTVPLQHGVISPLGDAQGHTVGAVFPPGMVGAYVSPQQLIPVMFGLQQGDAGAVGFDPRNIGFDPNGYVFPYLTQDQLPGEIYKKNEKRQKQLLQKRSLKMLTSQFLGEYGRKEGCIVHVEEASKTLNTSRRRLYDIMAVCAEIGLVSRAGKGQYMWHGDKHVDKAVRALSDAHGTPDKDVASLAGLTRGMVSYLVQAGPEKLVEVDCIAIKVLGLDETLQAKSLKTKLRRAYDVSSVLCALKMVRDDMVKERETAKHKRCLMWKGTKEISHAIQEAEKIDFTTYTSAPDEVEPIPSFSGGYVVPGLFPGHPGMVPGNGLGKDVVISLPEMQGKPQELHPFLNNNHPIGVPTDVRTQPDMAQHNLAMMQYLASASAMHMRGNPQNDNA